MPINNLIFKEKLISRDLIENGNLIVETRVGKDKNAWIR